MLLYFDARFLEEPSINLWPDYSCRETYWNYIIFTGNLFQYQQKLKVIKGQIGCTAAMLFLSLMFVISYMYTVAQSKNNKLGVQSQPAMELGQMSSMQQSYWSSVPPSMSQGPMLPPSIPQGSMLPPPIPQWSQPPPGFNNA